MFPTRKSFAFSSVREAQDLLLVKGERRDTVNERSVCGKCGGEDVGMRFCPGGGSPQAWFSACVLRHRGEELIHRNCKRCGYDWDEKPIDAK